MTAELYQIPALALMVALVAVFGGLWLQWKSQPVYRESIGQVPSARQRHLMWLAGWSLAAVQLAISGSGRLPGGASRAVALNCIVLAPLMFLGSLASQHFLRRPRILFIFAFGLPLGVFATLAALDPRPGPAGRIALLACVGAGLWVGAAWGLRRNLLPIWISLTLVAAFGLPCVWLTLRGEYLAALRLVGSGTLAMAALLFASAFRRATPGTLLTVGGLAVWALAGIQDFSMGPHLPARLVGAVNLVKVLTAVGMVVLVLEDEVAANRAAQLRDQRARREMERYTALYFGAMPYEIGSQEYDETCRTIAEASRFAQAAVFLRNSGGSFRLVGQWGLSAAQIATLDAMARRASDEMVEEIARPERITVEVGHLARIDLSPLLLPEDNNRPEAEPLPEDLRRPRIIGMRVREGGWQGALLLGGLRDSAEPLRMQDAMPLELLVARIAASRENAALLRQLMKSERLAGLGQLASGVAHELNNPLTAVTGFAELLTETEDQDVRDRAAVILNEARRMKKIIESLVRFRKLSPAGRAPFSMELLLRDIQELARHDLEKARVKFQISVASGLPRAVGDGEQLRQVFLQLVRNAITTLEENPAGEPRLLSVELGKTSDVIRTVFCDNGPGFSDPAQVFDPLFTTLHPGGGTGLGLSVCYSIIHEQGGEITAENVLPRGARIIIDLPAEARTAAGPEDSAAGALARAI